MLQYLRRTLAADRVDLIDWLGRSLGHIYTDGHTRDYC